VVLIKKILLFILSIVFSILLLIGATTSFEREQTSHEEILENLIEYHLNNNREIWDAYYEATYQPDSIVIIK